MTMNWFTYPEVDDVPDRLVELLEREICLLHTEDQSYVRIEDDEGTFRYHDWLTH